MHALGDSPCHLSAKHCILRACFPRTAPFRAMLLTARGGPRCLGSRAYEVPAYLIAFLHSYFALSRRTWALLSLRAVHVRSRPCTPGRVTTVVSARLQAP